MAFFIAFSGRVLCRGTCFHRTCVDACERFIFVTWIGALAYILFVFRAFGHRNASATIIAVVVRLAVALIAIGFVIAPVAFHFGFPIFAGAGIAFTPTFVANLIWIGALLARLLAAWLRAIFFLHTNAAFVAQVAAYTVANIQDALISGFSSFSVVHVVQLCSEWRIRYARRLMISPIYIWAHSGFVRFETSKQPLVRCTTVFRQLIALFVAIVGRHAFIAPIGIVWRFALAFVLVAFLTACRWVGWVLQVITSSYIAFVWAFHGFLITIAAHVFLRFRRFLIF